MDVWINITKNGIIDDVLEETKRLNEWIDRLSDTSKYTERQTDRYNANCNTNRNEDRQTEEYKRRIQKNIGRQIDIYLYQTKKQRVFYQSCFVPHKIFLRQ